MDDVCPHSIPYQLQSQIAAKEFTDRPDSSLRLCDLSDISSGFDAQNGDTRLVIPLQQVTIVTRDFDHQAVGAEFSSFAETICNGPCVSYHRVRE